MKIFTIIVDFLTTFIITAGGCLTVAFVVSNGQPLSQTAYLVIVATGLINSAKSTRNLINLPPLSNGNYEAIAQLVKNQNKQIVQNDRIAADQAATEKEQNP